MPPQVLDRAERFLPMWYHVSLSLYSRRRRDVSRDSFDATPLSGFFGEREPRRLSVRVSVLDMALDPGVRTDPAFELWSVLDEARSASAYISSTVSSCGSYASNSVHGNSKERCS